MKNLGQFTIAAAMLFAAANHLNAQNLNFPATTPSLSLSFVTNKKIDFNLLAVSKIRLGNYSVKGIDYNQQVLEIYSQALTTYHLTNRLQIGAGYGFQRNNPFDANWRNEHRLVEQVSYVIPLNKDKLVQRLRLEERWLSYYNASHETGTRARYELGYIKQLKGNMFYWQVNDEVFATTSGSRNSLISENWFYAGVGFTLKTFGHFEAGIGYDSNVRNAKKEWSNLLLLQLAWSFIVPEKYSADMHPAMDSRHF